MSFERYLEGLRSIIQEIGLAKPYFFRYKINFSRRKTFAIAIATRANHVAFDTNSRKVNKS